jgi:phenylacetate-CoA ligase
MSNLRSTSDIEALGRRRVAAGVATAGGVLRGLWLFPLDVAFRLLGLRYGWMKWLFTHAPPRFLAFMGRLRAERAAHRAIRRVPAYRRFLEHSGVRGEEHLPFGILRNLPETDKRNYIDPYSLEDRCVGGSFTFRGTMIDESSGSTGTPYNWIRSLRERSIAHRNIGFFARYAFGSGPLVTINAFSMGAWAAGFNMSLGMNRHGLVKSTGPDLDKIFSTLRYLGPRYRYLISGYPPFLKHLLDVAERDGFDLDGYELHALVGGEGMTEGLRDYLLGRFVSVYSGYGATDIEIGMAAESPVSIGLRRLARARPDVREALFGRDQRLPMVFQYNPLMHWLEVNDEHEIVATISRLDVLTPRIRYNVHDEGGVMTYGRAARVLARYGYQIDRLNELDEVAGPRGPLPWSHPIRLPFLWIHGRSDATISVMGANIYPEDIETIIYRDPDLARQVNSFLLSLRTDDAGTPRPGIAIELVEGLAVQDDQVEQLVKRFHDGLYALNIDYRTSAAEFGEAMLPMVDVWPRGTGVFAADADRIKQRRIVRD